MNFCSHCGQPVTLRVPEGDNRPRFVCAACGTIHYQNPKIVVGCLPEWEGRVLRLTNRIDVEVRASDFRTIRGPSTAITATSWPWYSRTPTTSRPKRRR